MRNDIYTFLSPDKLAQTYEKVVQYLPDVYRSPEAFLSLYSAKSSLFFEVGDFAGVFWLTDIWVGWKACVHIVLWGKEFRGMPTIAGEVLAELMDLLKLQRLEAFVPTNMRGACSYTERVGFEPEGVLRRAARYDGKVVDLAAYSIIRGEG